MRKLLFTLLLLASVHAVFSQDEFTVKVWKQPVSTGSYFRLDYFSNWKTVSGQATTSLFLSFIPRPGSFTFASYSGWSGIRIRDRATGKEYKITNGNGITLRSDAVFAFHNKGDEIGFSLDFETMPPTVRNIDVYWGDSKWFDNVVLDPARTNEDHIFVLYYLLRTISLFTTVNKTIYFDFENSSQSDLYINRYYTKPSEPSDCTASGTLTLAFPISEQGKPYTIAAHFAGEAGNRWSFTAEPEIGGQLISLNE
ncbi:MAG: hypothetical protein JWP27_1009 [Flaviaesturariibacter sp.]|nr:hypothetical protein [Flaviaesturariibacter sp.]